MSEKTAPEEVSEAPKIAVIKEAPSLSHTVILRRKPLNNYLPKEIQADAKSCLSSIFVGRQPLKGFDNDAEEIKYLTGVVDVGPLDKDWSKVVRKFWAELRIKVGFTGVSLEIGLYPDGTPLNQLDYVKYRFAKKHLLVADTEDIMMADSRKRFYIFDAAKASLKKNANIQMEKQADREFIKSSEDPLRMRNILQVLSKTSSLNFTDEAVENMLFDLKRADSKRFLEIATDKDLDTRALISELISERVLLKVGLSLVHMNETVANTEEEAISILKNPKNSGLLNIMKTKLRELKR